MTTLRTWKKKLAQIQILWSEQKYDQALSETEALRAEFPGNSKLAVLWASLVQLQENSSHTLDEAKNALQEAVQLDDDAPAAAIELGNFFDNVEDDPRAAAKVFASAAKTARRLLIDALMGQAKALAQLDKKAEAISCLAEAVRLAESTTDEMETLLQDLQAVSIS